jgi:hypothetical protein
MEFIMRPGAAAAAQAQDFGTRLLRRRTSSEGGDRDGDGRRSIKIGHAHLLIDSPSTDPRIGEAYAILMTV